jgi:hypothetical protein
MLRLVIMFNLFSVLLKCDLTKTAWYKLLEYREEVRLKSMDHCLHGFCCLNIAHFQQLLKSSLAFRNVAEPLTELFVVSFNVRVFRKEHPISSCVVFLSYAVLVTDIREFCLWIIDVLFHYIFGNTQLLLLADEHLRLLFVDKHLFGADCSNSFNIFL